MAGLTFKAAAKKDAGSKRAKIGAGNQNMGSFGYQASMLTTTVLGKANF
jgi:hypothetical protein